MNLHTFFADTVGAGWTPVSPCTDPAELAKLDACCARGPCMQPLTQDGDILYFDRSMPAQSGDIVVYKLSSRAVAALNDALPPGADPWSANSPYWVKLLAGSRANGLLVCSGGDLVTPSFMASECPTDEAPVFPVRNVRRAGRLLFTAEPQEPRLVPRRGMLAATVAGLALSGCRVDGVDVPELPPIVETDAAADTAQLGTNAATAIYTASVAGPVNVNTPGGNSASPAYLLTSISPAALPFDTTQVLTITGFLDMLANAQQNDAYVAASTTSGLNVGAVASAGGYGARNPSTGLPSAGGSFAIEQTYAVAAGTSQTYYIYGAAILSTSGSSAGSYVNVTNLNAKVEVIKR